MLDPTGIAANGRPVTPDTVRPGDTVIPTRGRYMNIPCKVKNVRRSKFKTHWIEVVPVKPPSYQWGVFDSEPVRTVPDE